MGCGMQGISIMDVHGIVVDEVPETNQKSCGKLATLSRY